MLDVTIIIVSWNCKQYTLDCLNSIFAHPVLCSFKVVIVDNASSDDSIDQIKRDYPQAKIIQNNSNIGFAAANNIAIKSLNSHFYFLLNADTIIFPNSIDALVETLRREKKVGVVGPKILNGDKTEQRTGIKFPSLFNIAVESFFLDRLFPQTQLFGSHKELYTNSSIARDVDYLQGSALMVKKEVIDTIGLLDENYFMYFEETDWCKRIVNAGWKVRYEPTSEIIHLGGGETAHYDENRILYYHQSLFKFFSKYHTPTQQILLRGIIFLRTIIRLVVWSVIVLIQAKTKNAAKSSLVGYQKLFRLIVYRQI